MGKAWNSLAGKCRDFFVFGDLSDSDLDEADQLLQEILRDKRRSPQERVPET